MFPLHGVLREIRSLNMPASVQKKPTEEHTCTVFRSEERDDN